MKILVAFTTYNQLEYTKLLLDSIKDHRSKYDVLFIDDQSTDGTVNFLKEVGENVITKKHFKGLTHSWNMAYQLFIKGKYDRFILSNNDVLIPSKSLEYLIKLCSRYPLVCPMSTERGVGHNPLQSIHNFYSIKEDFVNNPKNYIKVQNYILNFDNRFLSRTMPRFNGFCFAMSRDIANYSFDKKNLFNPANVNVHQEGDLFTRLFSKHTLPRVANKSFIYHFKGVSFKTAKAAQVQGKLDRQNLDLFH